MKIGNIDLGNRPVMLAPMEDVTDVSFRQICREQSADMVYTEFVSADALIRSISGAVRILSKFCSYYCAWTIHQFSAWYYLFMGTKYLRRRESSIYAPDGINKTGIYPVGIYSTPAQLNRAFPRQILPPNYNPLSDPFLHIKRWKGLFLYYLFF